MAAHGITPAWAGKSRWSGRPGGSGLDHPRVGGEKHPGHRCAGGLNGITPAWAGKRMQVSPKPTLPQDHPRVDGEKILEPSMGVGNFGSPPRWRGKAVKFRCTCGLQRITPAWAGKSCPAARMLPRTRDHPRVGGEKGSTSIVLPMTLGSPPRRRGKAHELRTLPRAVRITPA